MKIKLILTICFVTVLSLREALATQISSIDSPDKIYQKLGQKIDMNLAFVNQDGKTKTLSEVINKNSVLVLTLNYYRCKTMCTFQFLNLAQVIKESKILPGEGYTVASISFDPLDTVEKAKEIHDLWVEKTGNPAGDWNFFVGPYKNIELLTRQLNFYYEKDDEGNYSHAASLFFVQPDGTMYRYLYGIVYNKSDFVHALNDTSQGRLGGTLDKFKNLFSRYNPVRGKYYSIIGNI